MGAKRGDTVVTAAPRRSATRLDCRALPALPELKEPPLCYLDSATTSFLADSEPSAQDSATRRRSFVRKLDELDRFWKCSPKKQCIDDVKEHTEQPALVLVPDPPAAMVPAMQLSAECISGGDRWHTGSLAGIQGQVVLPGGQMTSLKSELGPLRTGGTAPAATTL